MAPVIPQTSSPSGWRSRLPSTQGMLHGAQKVAAFGAAGIAVQKAVSGDPKEAAGFAAVAYGLLNPSLSGAKAVSQEVWSATRKTVEVAGNNLPVIIGTAGSACIAASRYQKGDVWGAIGCGVAAAAIPANRLMEKRHTDAVLVPSEPSSKNITEAPTQKGWFSSFGWR